MLEALNAKNGYSNEHVVAVRATAVVIARRLRSAAPNGPHSQQRRLHDVGKITAARRHPREAGPARPGGVGRDAKPLGTGARLLATFARDERIVAIVRGHHERWDGNGYPDGLAGTTIPLGARIRPLRTPSRQ